MANKNYDKSATVVEINQKALDEVAPVETAPVPAVEPQHGPEPGPVVSPDASAETTPVPPPPVVDGRTQMELGICWLKRNDIGDNIPIGEREVPYGMGFEAGLTPAEAQVLRSTFQTFAKGDPFQQFEKLIVKGKVFRSFSAEKKRLVAAYGKVVNQIFPGINPTLPLTFAEIKDGEHMPPPAGADNPVF